ncbi:hypothetical protein [Nitratifractor salsuginis]|uniref:Lipoprotein n=1 Tax=Nitratifractor salsuginis (strain DSM 16511 / JCM 12458 / E9I37-1) TaxID=749222 RepID=E6X0I1_NITSE|nr:hypothetical protein [Nitratifractor salsuginis]ADV46831.1 hypothetical protein Nitsa_1583 [Nitratifractor salsuginis DSM 16511]
MKRLIWIVALAFFVGGCAMPTVPLFGKSEKILTFDDLDTQMQKQLPKSLKGKFCRVVLESALVQQGDQPGSLSLITRFVMTSFEIPEGIDGTLRYQAKLRYDPGSHALYFDKLEPVTLNFGGDVSLQEYISAGARQEIPVLVARALRSLVVYSFGPKFQAKRLDAFTVHQDKLTLEFE